MTDKANDSLKTNSFSEFLAEILDPKRWAIYQTEAIEIVIRCGNFKTSAKRKMF
jgi:hypothetical protein